MATYPGPVSAVQVGSYFVGQYYQVIQQQPEFAHQFYTDSSTMLRIDGDSKETASALMEIHNLGLSFNFTAIEVKTINSLESWDGGVMVVVTGSVKSRDFVGRRNFVQNFFLAPQEKGYFLLSDIFQFIDDVIIYQHPAPVLSETKYDRQQDASAPPELPVSDYVLEEEAREYVNSVHIEDDPVDKYSFTEQQQQYHDNEAKIVLEEAPFEETSGSPEREVTIIHEPLAPPMEEAVGEPPKKTWASILQVAESQSSVPYSTQQSTQKSAPAASEWNYIPQPTEQSFLADNGVEAVDEGFSQDEGEVTSVYVRNLPSTVTSAEIAQEFKYFGRIKPDGVFIRLRKEIGACYAFVEYEDILGAENAIKASPIELGGRQIYIEERRPNSTGSFRGGRSGRGRGNYQADSSRGRFGTRGSGRGNTQGGDYNSMKGNGFYQRVSR